MSFPRKFKELVEYFEVLPGVGPKTAERLAFFVISKKNHEASKHLALSIIDSIDLIKECPICGMITDQEQCDICIDEERENKLMIVENSKDVISFEKTKIFKGKYHVLNGLISPSNGIGPEDININKLLFRIKKDNFDEIIIATSSNIDGELTALYLNKVISNLGFKTYRIGYGLPASTEIEYVDEITLMRSLESKKEM